MSMTCATCGTTDGPFATLGRCMGCQRAIWRAKHAAKMADPARAAHRTRQLADYWAARRDAGLTHPETANPRRSRD